MGKSENSGTEVRAARPALGRLNAELNMALMTEADLDLVLHFLAEDDCFIFLGARCKGYARTPRHRPFLGN